MLFTTEIEAYVVTEKQSEYDMVFFIFGCIFILLSRESDQCAIRARLGVAGHLFTTPRWGNPAKCLSQRYNKYTCRLVLHTLSAAWHSGLERRFYDDHNRKVNCSTPNLVSLLRPWIRYFTMIISAWWNLASSKLKKSKENSTRKLGNKSNS